MYNTKDLDRNIRTIHLEGFSFEKEISGYSWTKASEGKTERIGLGYRGYPDGFYLYTPLASITFKEISKQLNFASKNLEVIQQHGDYTIHSGLGEISGINYEIFDLEINDEKSFGIVARETEKIITGAMEFFNKFKTIENVANHLAELKPQEVVPYIQGAQLFVKTILILKLANHHRYEEKKTEFREVLAQQAEKKDTYKQQLKIFDFLFSG